MELTSVNLSLDLDPRVVRSLHECAESSGRSLEQVVECILRQHLNVCCEEERQPVLTSSLTWDALIPYARRLQIGTRFNLYDLMIRMHSDKGLSSLKISSAWHSAFAQWVRRHNEFTCERSPKGNIYKRITDTQAPIPEVRKTDAVPFVDRMNNTELLNKIKDAAESWPIGQHFTWRDILAAFDQKALPKNVTGTMRLNFVRWISNTNGFETFYKKSDIETIDGIGSVRVFYRYSTNGDGANETTI